jgi:predicted nuclease with TOPRIM domain
MGHSLSRLLGSADTSRSNTQDGESVMDGWIANVISQFTPGAVGIWVVAGMLGVYFMREYRETRKLSLEDRLARRDGYARQVENLQNENRQLRAEMHQMNEYHEAYRQQCHRENDQLRGMLVNVQDEVEGLKRRVAQDALELARMRGIEGL